MEILKRDDMPVSGFADIIETRLVVDKKLPWSSNVPNAWDGMGSFVYLADAGCKGGGDTRMHPHKEVDVITIMIDGRFTHEGTLEHGLDINPNQVQVQRAGGEGFSHNEVNPDAKQNRLLQVWALPETSGEKAGYKFYDLTQGELTRVYGGSGDSEQNETFASKTIIEAGLLNEGMEINKEGEFMAYIARGTGNINGEDVSEGDLVRGEGLDFKSSSNDLYLFLVTTI